MADRIVGEMAKAIAYADLADAVASYLSAIGFTDVVLGPGATRSFHPYDTHEFFLPFTGTRPPDEGRE